MTEILPGIYRLQIPIPNNPLGYTNTYVLKGDNERVLIDPGTNTEEGFNLLKSGLAEIGVAIEDITQIIITHAHGDHYGLADRVKQLSQAKVLMHYQDGLLMQRMHTNMEERLRQTEQWLGINGVPTESSAFHTTAWRILPPSNPVMPDVTLQGDETLSIGSFNLKVLWTPGHSYGHICLYEPNQKILFSGDHILPVITPHISLQADSDSNPLSDFLISLKTLSQLDVRLVLPAHEHLFTNLPARIEGIIQHHAHRNLEILEALKPQPKTAYQISTEITWRPDIGGISFQDLTLWERRMAVLETLAHLQFTRLDGRVDKLHRDSIIYYQRI